MTPPLLITGGAGFIGAHTCLELLNAGQELVVVDNLSNSSETALQRVQELTGKKLTFQKLDLLDLPALEALFASRKFSGVIHFAGLKAVGESVSQPLRYYQNNLTGTLNLLQCMKKHEVRNLVFSSSATVYGEPERVPLDETCRTGATNPYGHTKEFIEVMLKDLAASEKGWRIIALRYFNPVGAHASGQLGEDPVGIPNNLMPFVMQVAVGRRETINVFGNDYPTPDGTGKRDYLHVVDLAMGHLAALEHLQKVDGFRAINLGTGHSHSVLEVVAAASKAVGRDLPFNFAPRRPGDVAIVFADPSRAKSELGWEAKRGLSEMVEDCWRWQKQNPNGYKG